MKFSSDRDTLGDRVIEVMRDREEIELTAIASQVDEEVGPVFTRVRRFVNEGTARSPRPGVYTLTESARESPSLVESAEE